MVNTFGGLNQLVVAIEECSELQKEISKIIRKKGDLSNLAEEIADVEIMLEQVKLHFSIGAMVEGIKEEKLTRLEKRLSE